MAQRKTPFAFDEWYHCFSRSIDAGAIFREKTDYERFLEALYLSNSSAAMQRSSMRRPSFEDVLSLERGSPIVEIGAYCLMPNHFHILLKEATEQGISKFMQRVGTSFSMYFNTKYSHVGNVFIKPFRSKHVMDDRYLRRVAQYIHLNPVELFEPEWKKGIAKNFPQLVTELSSYRFSSLPDYSGQKRIEEKLLNGRQKEFLQPLLPALPEMLDEAAAYFAELNV